MGKQFGRYRMTIRMSSAAKGFLRGIQRQARADGLGAVAINDIVNVIVEAAMERAEKSPDSLDDLMRRACARSTEASR